MFRFPRLLSLTAAAIAAVSLNSAAGAQLSPAEQRIPAVVDSETDRTVSLLEQLVNVNSGTLNLAGVRQVGTMMRAEFEPLGFDVEWIDMSGTGRAGHLVATHMGKGAGKRLLLIGHLDTVFEPDSPFQTFTREGDRAIGPGVGDNKGGLVVIIAALRAMQAAGTLDGADIKVVLTGDEERPGSPLDAARSDLIDAGKWADIALGFEGLASEDGKDYGTIARRSSTSWTLTTTGKSGHSSAVFSERSGYGAIYELARILDSFRRDLPEQNLTYNVGVMAGGTPAAIDDQGFAVTASGKTNIIASDAIARGDIRTLTTEQETRVRAAMQAIAAAHLPGTTATLEFADDGYPPMSPTEANRQLLAQLNVASGDLGMDALGIWDPARRGAADISFVAKDVDAALAGLATSGEGAHAEGEFIYLSSIPKQAKRMAVLMGRLAKEPRD